MGVRYLWATMRVFPCFFLLTCLPLLTTCTDSSTSSTGGGGSPAVKADISESLVGTWETVEVDVEIASYEGRDTSFRQTIREADWKKRYGVRPARTIFTPDGKHRRTHTLSDGTVTDVTNGLWKTQGNDSLLIIEPNTTLYYKHDLTGDRLVLTGLVDYDFDGAADDDYRSVLRLISRTQ